MLPLHEATLPTHPQKYVNQTFQNKFIRIIAKLPRVKPTVTSNEQTEMTLIKSRIRMLVRGHCIKSL
jgi:hypothetical protein